jgi:hypothetical protein
VESKNFKIKYMSKEQAIDFAKGLQDLSTDFRSDIRTNVEVYEQETKGAGKKFVDASHNFAKSSTARAEQYITDIQSLYKSIYGDGIETPGEGTDEGGEEVS